MQKMAHGEKIQNLIENIGRVFFGKTDALRLTVVALTAAAAWKG